MQLTPQERERRSRQAKLQHQRGQLGHKAVAKRAGERSAAVRGERASSIARGLLERHASEVEKTLLEVLRNGTRSEKLKALDIMVKSGLRGEVQQLNEVKAESEVRTREELIVLLATDQLGVRRGRGGAAVMDSASWVVPAAGMRMLTHPPAARAPLEAQG